MLQHGGAGAADKPPKEGDLKYEELKEADARRTAQHDLDPGRGGRTGDRADRRNRWPTNRWTNQRTELPNAEPPTRNSSKPRNFDPSRRRQAGRSCSAEQPDPGKDRSESAGVPTESEIADYYDSAKDDPVHDRNRAATSASSPTKTKRKSKRRRRAGKDNSPRAGKKSRSNTPGPDHEMRKAACRRA